MIRENLYQKRLILQSIVDKLLNNKTNIKVLEAGCGYTGYIKFRQNAYIVGIDISEKQLQRNTKLNEKILGDIQYYNFKSLIFDVIICWNVLEHLPKPELALKNFSTAIKDDGIIILVLPNVLSLKGLITKYTPHWFHVFVYKYMYGFKNAGSNETGPFKTYLKFFLSPTAIKKFVSNSFKIEYFSYYDIQEDLFQKKYIYFAYRLFKIFLKIISFGKTGDSDYIIVLKKIKNG